MDKKENTKTKYNKKKTVKPEITNTIPVKKAMRNDKEIYMEILQQIFAEYQRELYFSGRKMELLLNICLYDKDGKWKDTLSITAVMNKNMQTISCYQKEMVYEPVTIWNLIKTAVSTQDWRITSYGIFEKSEE